MVIYMGKNEIRPLTHTTQENQLQVLKGLIIKSKTLKLLGDNIREFLLTSWS